VRLLRPLRPGGSGTDEPDWNHRAFFGELDDQLWAIGCTLGHVHGALNDKLDSLHATSEPATSPTKARSLVNDSLAAQLALQTAIMNRMEAMQVEPYTQHRVDTA
jgi:hypothetical protein